VGSCGDDAVIVKASSGPRYVVGCRSKVDKEKLVPSTRVALDMTTLTIMRALPREVCPLLSLLTVAADVDHRNEPTQPTPARIVERGKAAAATCSTICKTVHGAPWWVH
jgi:hypothetical protein